MAVHFPQPDGAVGEAEEHVVAAIAHQVEAGADRGRGIVYDRRSAGYLSEPDGRRHRAGAGRFHRADLSGAPAIDRIRPASAEQIDAVTDSDPGRRTGGQCPSRFAGPISVGIVGVSYSDIGRFDQGLR